MRWLKCCDVRRKSGHPILHSTYYVVVNSLLRTGSFPCDMLLCKRVQANASDNDARCDVQRKSGHPIIHRKLSQ